MVRRNGDERSKVVEGLLSKCARTLTQLSSHLGAIPRILIFSHISQRDGAAMLRTIAGTLQEHGVVINHLILSTYQERLDGQGDIGELRIIITRSTWPD